MAEHKLKEQRLQWSHMTWTVSTKIVWKLSKQMDYYRHQQLRQKRKRKKKNNDKNSKLWGGGKNLSRTPTLQLPHYRVKCWSLPLAFCLLPEDAGIHGGGGMTHPSMGCTLTTIPFLPFFHPGRNGAHMYTLLACFLSQQDQDSNHEDGHVGLGYHNS